MTELELAAKSVAEGDDAHALHHLSGALALEASSERGLALLADIATRVDVLAQVPREGFVGDVLVRAWMLERAGVAEGIGYLAQAAQACPTRGYEPLLASWLTARQAQQGDLPPQERFYCYRLLAQLIEPTVGLHRLWPGERALLAGAVEVARALARFPADDLVGGIAGAVLRRAGLLAEALALTEGAAARGEPHALRAHGLTLRAAGRAAEAAAAFERLEQLQPSPVERIEQARCWFVAGDLARAAKLLAHSDLERDAELEGFARMCAGPSHSDPIESLDGLRRSVLGHRWLAPRHDATARALAQVPDEPAPIQLSIDGWEPPSNRLAAALFAGQGAAVQRVAYAIKAQPLDFDPLAAPPEGRLWRGLDADPSVVVQAVPAPPAALLEQVARVSAAAARDGDALALWTAAQREVPPGGGHALGFAHAMVHPPEGQSGRPEALYRWQCAAAALLACGPEPIDGLRGQALRALAHGQADWTASAAVFALTFLARTRADDAAFCRQAIIDTVKHLVKHPSEPRAEQLQVALQGLPGVPDEALVAFDAWGEAVFGE